MVSISTLVGIVPQQDKKDTLLVDGELFYKFNASFNGVHIPLVVSSFVWKDELFGKVIVKGYLDTTDAASSSKVRAMHIYAHTIEVAPVDLPECNDIKLYARVTRRSEVFPTKQGVDIRRLVATQTTHTGKTVVLSIVAKKVAARAMGEYKVGDYLDCIGHLRRFKNKYTVVCDTVPEKLLKEGSNNG